MATTSKKRKIDLNEHDLAANRIPDIVWKPLDRKNINKIRSKFRSPCEFLEAYKNGAPTYFVKCSTPKCKGNGSVSVFFASSKDTNYRGQLFERHLERAKDKNVNTSGQISIKDYIQPRIFTKSEKTKIKKAQCKLLSYGCEPLSFFESDRMVEYTNDLLKIATKNSTADFDDVHNSARTLSRASEAEAEVLKNFFRENSARLADEAKICIVLDHQTPPNSSKESSLGPTRFGIGLLLRSDDFERKLFLLDYQPVASSSLDNNEDRLNHVLADYGLLESVKALKVPVIGDLHGRKLCSVINHLIISSCGAHHSANLLEQFLTRHQTQARIAQMMQYIDIINKASRATKKPVVSQVRD